MNLRQGFSGMTSKLSAKQMALVILLGAVVAASGFLLPSPRHMAAPHPGYPVWLWGTLMFGLLIAGYATSLLTEERLKHGLLNERWPEDEVASLRAMLDTPWLVVVPVVCLIVIVFTFFLFPHRQNIGWALMTFSQCFTRLGMAVKRPASTSGDVPKWQGLAPLRSEHWGERKA